MTTEDAGDYGGTCDTCANGRAKPGHQQCPACERRPEGEDTMEESLVGCSQCGGEFPPTGNPRNVNGFSRCEDHRRILTAAPERVAQDDDLIDALRRLVDDSYSLIDESPRFRPGAAVGRGTYRCHQCEATRGDPHHPHTGNCSVGLAEAVLARLALGQREEG